MADTIQASTPSQTAPADALPRMTWEEFLAWVDEDTHAEWVDGQVILLYPPQETAPQEGRAMPSPATPRHQRVHKFLVHLLEAYLSERPLGEVLYAPLLMRLPEKPSGREPDVLVLLDEHADRLKDTYLDGPADIVVEIVSEDSQARDRGEKFTEYEAAGVTEYWLIDPLRQHADFYRLGADGRYDRIDLADDGRFHSAVLPGLSLDPAWLWRDPVPGLAEALQWTGEMRRERRRERRAE